MMHRFVIQILNIEKNWATPFKKKLKLQKYQSQLCELTYSNISISAFDCDWLELA